MTATRLAIRFVLGHKLLVALTSSLLLILATAASFVAIVDTRVQEAQREARQWSLPIGWVAVEPNDPVEDLAIEDLHVLVEHDYETLAARDDTVLSVLGRTFVYPSSETPVFPFAPYAEGTPPHTAGLAGISRGLADALQCRVGCVLEIDDRSTTVTGIYRTPADARELSLHLISSELSTSPNQTLVFDNFDPVTGVNFDSAKSVVRNFTDVDVGRADELSNFPSRSLLTLLVIVAALATGLIVFVAIGVTLLKPCQILLTSGFTSSDLWLSALFGGISWGIGLAVSALLLANLLTLTLSSTVESLLNQQWERPMTDLAAPLPVLVIVVLGITAAAFAGSTFAWRAAIGQMGRSRSRTRGSSDNVLWLSLSAPLAVIIFFGRLTGEWISLMVVLSIATLAGVIVWTTFAFGRRTLLGKLVFGTRRSLFLSATLTLTFVMLPLTLVVVGATSIISFFEQESGRAAPPGAFVVTGSDLDVTGLEEEITRRFDGVLLARWRTAGSDSSPVRILDGSTASCIGDQPVLDCMSAVGENSVVQEVGVADEASMQRFRSLFGLEDQSETPVFVGSELTDGSIAVFDREYENVLRKIAVTADRAPLDELGGWLPGAVVGLDSDLVTEAALTEFSDGGLLVGGAEEVQEISEIRGLVASGGASLQLYYEDPNFDSRIAEIRRYGPALLGAVGTIVIATLGALLAVLQTDARRVTFRLGASRFARFGLGVTQAGSWAVPAVLGAYASGVLVLYVLSRDGDLVAESSKGTLAGLIGGLFLGCVVAGAWYASPPWRQSAQARQSVTRSVRSAASSS